MVARLVAVDIHAQQPLARHVLGPVSYTHLDVYKRQSIGKPIIEI